MTSDEKSSTPSKSALWVGCIMTALAGAFMFLDGIMKLVKPEPVVKATMQLGFPESSIVGIGIALLACTILYLVPPTCVLGAILLTGYLGGAVAANLRLGEPMLSHTLFPVYFAILVWGGLFLRDPRLRALVPFRRCPAS